AFVPYPFDIKISETRIIVNSGSDMCLFFYDRNGEFIIQKLSSNSGITSMIGNPSYFDIDPNGDIWLSDYQRHCICQIDSNGVLIRRFGKPTQNERLSNA
ncbi:hypothetical protein, partial [Salmonella sp. s51228]|uniref:hypothetical protein n=1 Tax=Salmonella sp. s51228 TaxID=3159652 RepID=UPI003980537D